MSYDFNSYQADTTDRPMNKAWGNWWKREKVGDKVQGYIADAGFRKAEGIYKDARVITLEQLDKTLINVSIKRLDFILSKTNNLRVGDPLTVVFEEEQPSKKAGYNATKIDGFYGKNLPENAANKTVAEMELIDMGLGAKTKEDDDAADKEFAAAGAAAPTAPGQAF